MVLVVVRLVAPGRLLPKLQPGGVGRKDEVQHDDALRSGRSVGRKHQADQACNQQGLPQPTHATSCRPRGATWYQGGSSWSRADLTSPVFLQPAVSTAAASGPTVWLGPDGTP